MRRDTELSNRSSRTKDANVNLISLLFSADGCNQLIPAGELAGSNSKDQYTLVAFFCCQIARENIYWKSRSITPTSFQGQVMLDIDEETLLDDSIATDN